MATKGYKGKRNNITFPVSLAEVIEDIAEKENRAFSQAVVLLCIEAIKARGIEYDITDYLRNMRSKAATAD
ncbi:MAG: hypothetical protein KME29_31325 [Calothrix sp. FI2-JRJ7]|nr:hypothetical protein [Calothrix sp. FI2-JRJ7]